MSAQPFALGLGEAVQRGLKFNLGTIGAGEAARQASAQRLTTLAQLLPDIFGDVRENIQQVNLAAQGFRISAPIPGFQFPRMLGPFNNFDACASF